MIKRSPLITIIGVPNTGKSTLFNRLIGKRKALIHSDPGMTRDIFKKTFEINGRSYTLQDSGGFFLNDEMITREINKKIMEAVRNSDLVIFLFDGKRELLGYEKDLYLHLKKIQNHILSVMNKVDNPEKFIMPSGYYSLKLDYIEISAEHNIGIEILIEEIEARFSDYQQNQVAHDPSPLPETRISIVGKPNVGKSSIVNRILNDQRVIVSPIPGTTRDSVDLEIKIKGQKFIFVDNAGIRKLQKVRENTESAAVIRAGKDIKKADIIIFVVDLSRKVDQNDLYIARKILNSAKPVILVGNKWDLVENQKAPEVVLKKIRSRFNFLYFAPLILVSAKTGKNIHILINRIEAIDIYFHTEIKTSHLNKIMQKILVEKKLITENNKTFNPKYASIESRRPFFICFHMKSRMRLKASSETYVKKRILQELNLEGVPLFFKIMSKK
jgi:GTP-binding protein